MGSNIVNGPKSLGAQADRNWGTPRVTNNGGTPTEHTGNGSRIEDQANKNWQTPAVDSFRSRGGERKNEKGLDQQARTWPTATVHGNHNQKGMSKHSGTGLSTAAKTWPTPNASPSAPNNSTNRGGGKHRARKTNQCLEDVAKSTWPTPQAHDAKTGKTPEQVEEHRERHAAGVRNLNETASQWPTPSPSAAIQGQNQPDGKRGQTLVGAARGQNWQTPNTVDAKGGDRKGEGQPQLCHQVKKATWKTPNTKSHGSESAERKRELGRTNSGGGDLLDQSKTWIKPETNDCSDTHPDPTTMPPGATCWPSIRALSQRDILDCLTSRKYFATSASNDLPPSAESERLSVVKCCWWQLQFDSGGKRLNPRFVNWLMCVPFEWTNCDWPATPFSHTPPEQLGLF